MKHRLGVTPDSSEVHTNDDRFDVNTALLKAVLSSTPILGGFLAEGLGIIRPNRKVDDLVILSEILKDRIENLESSRKRRNLESITRLALSEMVGKEDWNNRDASVEPDWFSTFFSSCEDISDQEVQALWSKILAGEISNPGSFSLRTVLNLKSMSKSELEIFQKIASYTLYSEGRHFIDDTIFGSDSDSGLSLQDQALMFEIDLLKRPQHGGSYAGIEYGTREMQIAHGNRVIGFQISKKTDWRPSLILTRTGSELSKLVEPKADDKYLVRSAIDQSGMGEGMQSVWIANLLISKGLVTKKIDESSRKPIDPYLIDG